MNKDIRNRLIKVANLLKTAEGSINMEQDLFENLRKEKETLKQYNEYFAQTLQEALLELKRIHLSVKSAKDVAEIKDIKKNVDTLMRKTYKALQV